MTLHRDESFPLSNTTVRGFSARRLLTRQAIRHARLANEAERRTTARVEWEAKWARRWSLFKQALLRGYLAGLIILLFSVFSTLHG